MSRASYARTRTQISLEIEIIAICRNSAINNFINVKTEEIP